MTTDNPLLAPWTAPHGLPPFAQAQPEHFVPAFTAALAAHRAELDAIASQAELPSFDNTLAAFDRSGRLLARLDLLFGTLTSSHNSPDLQAAQRTMAAPLAAHESAVYMHAGLFARVDALYRERQALGLRPEQLRLLERVHLDFVRAGARLGAAEGKRYAEVMEQLAELHTRFGQNVLADEADYQLRLESEADLAGLPDFVRAAAKNAALDRGVQGAHVITLSRSLIVPFLTFSERRDLREQAFRAWVTRGEHEGATDNRQVARDILTLRNEQARLHGHACYADYALADTMAGTQAAVTELLEKVWTPAKHAAEREREALAAQMAAMGHNSIKLEAWDWRYYAEKVRQARYALDEAEVKPYFPLDAMVGALFDCAERLFGLRFKHRPDLVAYHPDVKIYEVYGADSTEVRGVFLHDNFARPSKRSGAWMNALRWQARNGLDTFPVINNNNNFAKGSPGEPTLLGFDDVRTLFHEFGHGLHGLLSNVEYERLSGTQVLRDFVELPSQIFEHWMAEPAVLQKHARHYLTGEPIPAALLAKLKAAQTFGQGYETVRYTASALIDMAIHALTDAEAPDVLAFEAETLARYGLPDAVGLNHRYTHFQHLFSGNGYAAGYYVYLWAEVLDCDGYQAFVEAGSPFDAQVAASLLQNIYSSGNSREPRAAFRAFRGRDAVVEPMLRERGLLVGEPT
ncbi:MAG TPA: M3 family metallopeptidase [Burkholderiaceae bacterium]